MERVGLREWPGTVVPKTFADKADGHEVVGFPALVDTGDAVALRVLETAEAQQQAMWAGTRRLLLLQLPSPVGWVRGKLDNRAKLALSNNPHGGVAELLEDCLDCAVDGLVARFGGPVWDEAGFGALREKVRAELHDTMLDVVQQTATILDLAHGIRQRLASLTAPALAPAVDDIRTQLGGLVRPRFVTATGLGRLRELPRYLRAVEHRLDRLPTSLSRDLEQTAAIQALEDAYDERLEALANAGPDAGPVPAALDEVRWMIEELRVSMFAQQLGTRHPVSEKRVRRALERA